MRRWLILAVLFAVSTAAANPTDPAQTLEPPAHPCKPPAASTPMWLTFRAETSIRDLATFEKPHQYGEGVSHVIVNGQVAFENGKMTDARPGKILLGPATRVN